MRRRWPSIAAIVVLALGASIAITVSATPQYESTARVFISADLSSTASTDAYAASLFSQGRVKSYAALATSRELMLRVILNNDLTLTPSQLAERITAAVEQDTVIIRIVVTDPDPASAQKIASTEAEELASYLGQLETPVGSSRPPVKATVVDPASFNANPVSPRVALNLGIAVLLGLLVGIALAVVRELLDSSIKSAEDIQAAIAAPILADFHFDSEVASDALIFDAPTHSPRAEAFRVMRTNLQFLDLDEPPRAVVITSAVPAEGKTTTAANLAMASAQAGLRVLLVDCDLRRPRVANMLRLEPSVGFTTALVGKTDLAGSIQRHTESGVFVLASGPIPPNPTEILQSQATAKLLAELRSMFDLVIIDAPPLLPVADAAILAREVDGAIVVVHYGRTTKDQLQSAHNRLAAVDARVLGVAMNMSPRQGLRGYGYSSDGYGYGYGETEAKPRKRWSRAKRTG